LEEFQRTGSKQALREAFREEFVSRPGGFQSGAGCRHGYGFARHRAQPRSLAGLERFTAEVLFLNRNDVPRAVEALAAADYEFEYTADAIDDCGTVFGWVTGVTNLDSDRLAEWLDGIIGLFSGSVIGWGFGELVEKSRKHHEGLIYLRHCAVFRHIGWSEWIVIADAHGNERYDIKKIGYFTHRCFRLTPVGENVEL
jgi:hypothetical protein